jgi:hypothetical protein
MTKSLSILLLLSVASTALAQAQLDLADEQKDKKLVGTVRFETGSDKLTPESKGELKKAVAELARTTDGEILVVGHTDRLGTAEKNIPLSRARAELVKRELLKQGVRASRIRVFGAGFTRLLDPAETPDADAKNRRAELWVGPEPPLAWVSWIRKIVESKKPAAQDWAQAVLDEELEKRFRVRTRLDSAGEITFNRGNKLYLGSDALVVIEDRAAGADKKRVSDVTLEEGELLARLANKEGRIGVNSPNGRVDLDEGRYRTNSSAAKEASTVSAYVGKAKVSGAGSSVNVSQGYGTRVKKGAKPEAPTKLPAAPTWTVAMPAVVFVDEPVALEYTPAPGTTETLVELTTQDDPEFQRPIKSVRFSNATDPRPQLSGLEKGTYRVRLAGVDERGIVGESGAGKAFALVSPPVSFSGKPLATEGDALVLTRPGDIRFPPTSGTLLRVTEAPEKATAGKRAYRLTVDGVEGERIVYVVVRIAEPTPVVTSTRVAYYDPPAEAVDTIVAPEPARGQWYLHVLGGIEANRQADLGPSILGEFGFRFVDPVLPTTDLGLRTGFISASGVPGIQGTPVPSGPSFADRPTGDLTMIPIQLALTVGWKFGVVHPHLGGAVGLRVLSSDGVYGDENLDPVGFSFTVSGGLGFDLGPLELTLDAGFAHSRLTASDDAGTYDADDYLDGFTAHAGLKYFFGELKPL